MFNGFFENNIVEFSFEFVFNLVNFLNYYNVLVIQCILKKLKLNNCIQFHPVNTCNDTKM